MEQTAKPKAFIDEMNELIDRLRKDHDLPDVKNFNDGEILVIMAGKRDGEGVLVNGILEGTVKGGEAAVFAIHLHEVVKQVMAQAAEPAVDEMHRAAREQLDEIARKGSTRRR